MADIAIRAENLSKRYKIGERERYKTLRDVLTRSHKMLTRGSGLRIDSSGEPRILKKEDSEHIWALMDVSFCIHQGEAVGIIGRNGSGKSTLLKLLSRITAPTAGNAEIYGRVGSLLEVGTGFHPELTGRENIFLNGAILGMKRDEITTKFDEMVAFAEVERFIDTPVKYYSSGMYVRLAFAVAAHLETEILLVDEVLAVGDASFQKKCLTKMDQVLKIGRTVLFVSHNLSAVQSLCNRGILLDSGMVSCDSSLPSVLECYLDSIREQTVSDNLLTRNDRKGGEKLRFEHVQFTSERSKDESFLFCGKDVTIELYFQSLAPQLEMLRFGILFKDKFSGMPLIEFNSYYSSDFNFRVTQGKCKLIYYINKFPLAAGEYVFDIICTSGLEVLDWLKEAGIVVVEEGPYYSTGRMPLSNITKFHYDFRCELKGL
jgi:lipopolysaccharide transport system ATP-binding protein